MIPLCPGIGCTTAWNEKGRLLKNVGATINIKETGVCPIMKRMRYADAGVNIDQEEKAVKAIVSTVSGGETITLNDHRLVLCTDGVGSKVMIATALQKWDTVGIDCVAMNVNDALCMGARPLAFVDYLAVERTDASMAHDIAVGLRAGTDQAGIPIIGGETATLPEVIRGFDLAGTCVGVIEHELPQDMEPGDIIIGLQSSGLHSNGYSLARKVFSERGYSYHDTLPGMDASLGSILLAPTCIYVKEVLSLLEEVPVKGIAHITGSGLRKMKRLSQNVRFSITHPFCPQDIFRVMQELGNITSQEMYQTFNMGMGLAVVVAPGYVDAALTSLQQHSLVEVKQVGEVTEGTGVVVPSLDLRY